MELHQTVVEVLVPTQYTILVTADHVAEMRVLLFSHRMRVWKRYSLTLFFLLVHGITKLHKRHLRSMSRQYYILQCDRPMRKF